MIEATPAVVATAGHVDHGKSTLVRALTGTDPDRLAEEQARGLTIDLGFAMTTLPSGREVSFVDVPGHVRFLKNMLAGVGAVSCCLFVVAATEGWKPQSEEHLRILDALGLSAGVVALTKVGLLDGGRDGEPAGLAVLEVGDRLRGTFLDGAEVIAVDGVSGDGLDELRAALDRLVSASGEVVDRDRPRLWVDRSFAARGAGTIVTGTLTGGPLAVDDEIVVRPGRPGGETTARVRRLESHGRDRPAIGPGSRVAVNLSGIRHDRVRRGDAVVRPGQWHASRTLDASLSVLESLGHPVSRRGAHLAYVGSGEWPVRLRVLGTEALAPGSTGLVRLHLPVAVPLVPGDRYVLRDAGRQETVGGGEVLDIDPVRPAAQARPDRSIERVIAERGWIRPDELERLTGERRPPDVGGWIVAPEALAAASEDIRHRVRRAGPLGLDVAALDERERTVLPGIEGVVVARGTATLAGENGEPGGDPADDAVLALLDAEPFQPPPVTGDDRRALRDLIQRGLAVEQDGIAFSAAAVDRAAAIVADLLAATPEGVTVGQVREALGTSRKYAVPLLTVLDRTGRTRRRGDLRIAGPRLS